MEKVLYLAPAPEEHGHWVVKKGDPPRLTKSILRMTTEPEDENQWLALERELMDAWTVRRRLRDKSTVNKLEGFEDPEEDRKDEVLKRNSRIVELIEEEMKKMVDDDPESVVDEMVLIGALRKMIKCLKTMKRYFRQGSSLHEKCRANGTTGYQPSMQKCIRWWKRKEH